MIDLDHIHNLVKQGKGLSHEESVYLLSFINGQWHTDTSILKEGQQVWICFNWKGAPDDLAYGYAIWSEGEWFFDIQDTELLSQKKALELCKDPDDVADIVAFMFLPELPKFYNGVLK